MHSRTSPLLLVSTILLLAAACVPAPGPDAGQETATVAPALTPTATPTVVVGSEESEPTPSPTPTTTPASMPVPSACAGLSGELEAQITVGPAEVVGLEPAAVGAIPFSVTSDHPPYTVAGENTLSYQDTLQKEWGTYSVSLDMQITVHGVCTEETGVPMLDLALVTSGRQLVEVSAAGTQYTYPWSGENSLNLRLPAEEGATAEGEGWVFVLHLD